MPLRRLLILNRYHIGDALFTTPALAALRAAHPEARIVNAAPAPLRDLFSASTDVDEFWPGFGPRFQQLVRTAMWARSERFDAVVAFAFRSSHVRLSALASRAPIRAGYRREGIQRLLTTSVTNDARLHEIDNHLRLVGQLGAAPVGRELRLNTTSSWESGADEAASRISAPEAEILGLHVGSSNLAKNWPPEHWAELSDRCRAAGYVPVLLGGPADGPIVESIRESARIPPPSLQGALGLGPLAAFLRRCAVLVSADTGPMHMAVAVGTPVVALFGPSDPVRTGPVSGTSETLVAPQSGDGSRPMTGISVGEVQAAVERLRARKRENEAR